MEDRTIFVGNHRSHMYMYVCYVFREDLSKLDYTTMCIKETLRLYTVGIQVGKLSSEDVVVDGYRIPKGTYAPYSG